MNKLKLTFLLLLMVRFTVLDGNAQTRYILKTVDIVIPTVLDLAITSGPNQVADFNSTSSIDNGIELLAATKLSFKTNTPYYVTIKASTPNFSGGIQGDFMPVSVIGYRINGTAGAYTPLSATEAPLIGTSGSKIARGKGSTMIDFRIDPGYIYAPAQNYTLQIIYTISNL